MCKQENLVNVKLTSGKWLNRPSKFTISEDTVEIVTEPNTDLWQRSYYGFRNDNAPALLFTVNDNFTFTAKASFKYNKQFDQCGLLIYFDSNNWFKSSIEYENDSYSRLGSVVTNSGYSDWATSDISLPSVIWYRLSRRGPDFLIENSVDGKEYKQMRIFHLHVLGETNVDMGKANPPLPAKNSVQFGVYACSPNDSTFSARFTEVKLEPCSWLAYSTPIST
jgi:regulation of enolase protein 1 (concanavalin A-like superfamily)